MSMPFSTGRRLSYRNSGRLSRRGCRNASWMSADRNMAQHCTRQSRCAPQNACMLARLRALLRNYGRFGSLTMTIARSGGYLRAQLSRMSKSYADACGLARARTRRRLPAALFGLVGVNGAGKTTLIKCLLDFCEPDARRHRDLRCCRAGIPAPARGSRFCRSASTPLLPHRRGFPALHAASCIRCRYEPAQVEQHACRCSISTESALAQAGARLFQRHDPEARPRRLPALGKDLLRARRADQRARPQGACAAQERLRRLRSSGRTVFFTSHALADVDELCDRMAVIARRRAAFLPARRRSCVPASAPHLEQAFWPASSKPMRLSLRMSCLDFIWHNQRLNRDSAVPVGNMDAQYSEQARPADRRRRSADHRHAEFRAEPDFNVYVADSRAQVKSLLRQLDTPPAAGADRPRTAAHAAPPRRRLPADQRAARLLPRHQDPGAVGPERREQRASRAHARRDRVRRQAVRAGSAQDPARSRRSQIARRRDAAPQVRHRHRRQRSADRQAARSRSGSTRPRRFRC